MKKSRKDKSSRRPDYDPSATKEHVMAAGREILLAAQGALRFCKNYVETSPESRSKPELANFFSRAIEVADDLGRSILETSPVKRAAEEVARTFLSSIGEEMGDHPVKSRRAAGKRGSPRRKSSRRK